MKKTYTLTKENGDTQEVEPEPWGWAVIYDNNEELHQFSKKGEYHQFTDIDFDRVNVLTMYKLDDMDKQYHIPVTDDMQIFHFYRNVMPWYADEKIKVYVFGFKVDGVESYHFILPDDQMVISDHDNIDLPSLQVTPRDFDGSFADYRQAVEKRNKDNN